MKAGLVGLPSAGKSTLFQLLTGAAPAAGGRPEARVGIARVPDPRVDALARMYNPKKTTPATVEFVDVPGTAEDIARTMSVRGFAVEGIEPAGNGDAVIDFEVTANRPDCMSVAGMAREVATAYGLQVRRPAARSRSSAAETNPADAPGLWLVSLTAKDTADAG